MDDLLSARQPRVIANITLTIDGHTTGPGGPQDMGCIAPYGMSEEARDQLTRMTEATTAVMGRANFEGFGGYWPHVADALDADPRDRTFARWLNNVEKVVLSTTLGEPVPWTNSRVTQEPPETAIAALRASSAGDIRILSSQSVIRRLLDHDQIDVLEINLAPEITGGGASLFDPPTATPSRWHLLDVTPSTSGAALLRYQREGKNA